jgi:hypothetical protein
MESKEKYRPSGVEGSLISGLSPDGAKIRVVWDVFAPQPQGL